MRVSDNLIFFASKRKRKQNPLDFERIFLTGLFFSLLIEYIEDLREFSASDGLGRIEVRSREMEIGRERIDIHPVRI